MHRRTSGTFGQRLHALKASIFEAVSPSAGGHMVSNNGNNVQEQIDPWIARISFKRVGMKTKSMAQKVEEVAIEVRRGGNKR